MAGLTTSPTLIASNALRHSRDIDHVGWSTFLNSCILSYHAKAHVAGLSCQERPLGASLQLRAEVMHHLVAPGVRDLVGTVQN
jgi:hypothetical protein